MKRRLLRLSLILASCYLLGCALLFFKQDHMLYQPYSGPDDPVVAGLADFTSAEVETNDARIIIWRGPEKSEAPILLYFHGNGGGLFAFTGALRWLADRDLEVWAMEYRGYPRGAKGVPSQQALTTDAAALYDHLKKKWPDRPIIVWGYSLGSGVATQLAAIRPVDALILEAPFTAIVDRAAELFPYVPVRFMMRDRYLSREVIGDIKAPLFIMHGDDDRLVPIEHGEALFALAGEPKTFKLYEDADHFDLMTHGAYDDALDFLRQALDR